MCLHTAMTGGLRSDWPDSFKGTAKKNHAADWKAEHLICSTLKLKPVSPGQSER